MEVRMVRLPVVGGIVALALVTALAACSGSTAPGQAAVVSRAQRAPGTAALNTLTDAEHLNVFPEFTSVSCTSPGSCAAVGKYVGGNNAGMFVISEQSGVWGDARPLPGVPPMDPYSNEWRQPGLVSCSAPGDCAVAASDGNYQDPMLATERLGEWTPARYIPGLRWGPNGTCISDVSCSPGAGYCAAGGSRNLAGYVLSERRGTWGPVHAVPGADEITALSCPAPGDCLAVGGMTRAFLVTERDFRWGMAQPVPGLATLASGGLRRFAGATCPPYTGRCNPKVTAVSCPAPGNCAIAGTYIDTSDRLQVFVASEQAGVWGTALPAPGLTSLNLGGDAEVAQLSCASPGNCAVGGWYRDRKGSPRQQAWVSAEVAGRWGMAQEVQGLATLNVGEDAAVLTVSCGRPRDCVAGGYYASSGSPGDFTRSAFLIRERSGAWGRATAVPGLAALDTGQPADSQVSSISCVPGWCAAVGTYSAANGTTQFFVLNLQ